MADTNSNGRPGRPNFLLILSDELRADALGCYGSAIVRSPNLDRLAREGTRFDQCMVTQPTCTPSRASMLSGAFPSALRTRMVGCTTPVDPRFLPRVLAAAGYRTASIGKIHLVPQRDEVEALARRRLANGKYDYYGFQEVDLVDGHGDRCFGPAYNRYLHDFVPDHAERLARTRRMTPGVNNAKGSLRTSSFELPESAHSSNYIADRTVKFLESATGGGRDPFFLHVSFPDPHHPFTVPEPWASMYDPFRMPAPVPHRAGASSMPPWYDDVFRGVPGGTIEGGVNDRVTGTPPDDYSRYRDDDWRQVKAIYYGMISMMDAAIGRILDSLDRTGLSENTVVIFVSDHGEYLGDHGFAGKGYHYDNVLRTPYIWRGPAIRQGQTVRSIASTLDLSPTILDLAGVAEPEGVQGQSVSELLAGSGASARTAALTENDDDFAPLRMRTITTERWKLTAYLGETYGELYDRTADPTESNNLWENAAVSTTKQMLKEMLFEEVLASIDVANGRRQAPAPPTAKWVARHNRPGYEEHG